MSLNKNPQYEINQFSILILRLTAIRKNITCTNTFANPEFENIPYPQNLENYLFALKNLLVNNSLIVECIFKFLNICPQNQIQIKLL